ncbi:DUF5018 domain-containing protein [Runella sp.]|uniref:DUF5018 domain-containing protein n=1 Tax=Runella sp. TaxID=1960881 RepID=UPI003D11D4F2
MPKFFQSAFFSRHTYLYIILCLFLFACPKDPAEPTKSSANSITSFSFEGLTPAIRAIIDNNQQLITASLPIGTDSRRLIPSIVISEKATISPASGVAQDFSKPITYTVTAEDGSTKSFEVRVTVAKSSAKQMLTFVFNSLTPAIIASIDTINHNIIAELPYSTNPSALAPTISISLGAVISPASGAVQDFSKPIMYTITAEDGTKQTYTAAISKARPTKDDIAKLSNQWENILPMRLDLREVTANGAFWGIISSPGYYLSTYQNGKEYVFNKPGSKIPTQKMGNIVELDNTVWVNSTAGLIAITAGDTTLLNSKNSDIAFENAGFLKVLDNSLYCSVNASLYKLVQGKWQKVLTVSDGTILNFTQYKGVFYLNTTAFLYKYDGTFEKFTKPVTTGSISSHIDISATGTVWISDWSNLTKFKNGVFQRFSSENTAGFPPSGMQNFVIDNNEMVWMAWGKHGIVVFEGDKIVHNFLKTNSSLLTDNFGYIVLKNNIVYVGFYSTNSNLAVAKLKLN